MAARSFSSASVTSVQGEAQELGEARLARSVEAGDPGGRKLGAPGLVALARHRLQQVDKLLVNARAHPLRPGIGVGVATGDDVLSDFVGELLRALLMKINHRRNVAGDVESEQVADAQGLIQ